MLSSVPPSWGRGQRGGQTKGEPGLQERGRQGGEQMVRMLLARSLLPSAEPGALVWTKTTTCGSPRREVDAGRGWGAVPPSFQILYKQTWVQGKKAAEAQLGEDLELPA